MTTLLRTADLCFAWKGRDWIHNLNFQIDGGHIYGLMGRNGAGKTTLLKLMAGALQPKNGKIFFQAGGTELSPSLHHPDTTSEIVFVAESSVLPNITPLRFGQLLGPLYPRFSQEQYKLFLEQLLVDSHQKMDRLSFGQKRKVHIALALAANSALVILDEPTNGLDIAAQITLRKMLIAQTNPQRAIIVSTHHVREFENVVDHVIVVDDGKILADVPTDSLANDSSYRDLETWYAQLLQIPVNFNSPLQGVSHEH